MRMAFNAIKHNKEILLKIVEELEDSRKIRADGNSLIVERAILSSDTLRIRFFAIAILSSVIDFWREKIDEPKLKNILKTFKELYENLGLEVNLRFLEMKRCSISIEKWLQHPGKS